MNLNADKIVKELIMKHFGIVFPLFAIVFLMALSLFLTPNKAHRQVANDDHKSHHQWYNASYKL